MASITTYLEEKNHVLFVYDAPMASQIHFCFTINEVYYGGKRLIFFRHSSFLNLAISATEHGYPQQNALFCTAKKGQARQ